VVRTVGFPVRLRYIAASSRYERRWVYVPSKSTSTFRKALHLMQTRNALLAAVLNPDYGAGLKLAPGASLDDGSLHVVLIEDYRYVLSVGLYCRGCWGVVNLELHAGDAG